MSYSGYVEYILESGEYVSYSCWDDEEPANWAYRKVVDTTNGSDPEEPWTMPGLKEEIGFKDIWKEDHYGNKYAVKQDLYKPLDGYWEKRDSHW